MKLKFLTTAAILLTVGPAAPLQAIAAPLESPDATGVCLSCSTTSAANSAAPKDREQDRAAEMERERQREADREREREQERRDGSSNNGRNQEAIRRERERQQAAERDRQSQRETERREWERQREAEREREREREADRQERERQREADRERERERERDRYYQTQRDWERERESSRWYWDNWRQTFSHPLVGSTRLELTSISNDWVTVSIEGLNGDRQLSFTGNDNRQTLYLPPGAYRIRFRPTFGSRHWESGYLNVGRTNLMRIMFDQDRNLVQIYDDPYAWNSEIYPSIRTYPGY